MQRLTTSFSAILLAAGLSGCVFVSGEHSWDNNDWQDKQRENREIISDLDIGMKRNEVLGLLGTPNFSEAYTRDGNEYRVLFFRTQHRHADGETSKDETTPLVFKNNTLIGWGNDVFASLGGTTQ